MYIIDTLNGEIGITKCEVISEDFEKGIFNIILYGNSICSVLKNDKDILFFETEEAARKMIKSIPKKGHEIYVLIDNVMCKKVIESYNSSEYWNEKVYDVNFKFTDQTQEISVNEFGKNAFADSESALEELLERIQYNNNFVLTNETFFDDQYIYYDESNECFKYEDGVIAGKNPYEVIEHFNQIEKDGFCNRTKMRWRLKNK